MPRQSIEKTRRRFLRSAAAAGGAAAVATAAAGVSETVAPAEPRADTAHDRTDRQGYRVTPHVKTYYRLARQ